MNPSVLLTTRILRLRNYITIAVFISNLKIITVHSILKVWMSPPDKFDPHTVIPLCVQDISRSLEFKKQICFQGQSKCHIEGKSFNRGHVAELNNYNYIYISLIYIYIYIYIYILKIVHGRERLRVTTNTFQFFINTFALSFEILSTIYIYIYYIYTHILL